MTSLTGPLRDAAAAALRGELIVFPTDTVYGWGRARTTPRPRLGCSRRSIDRAISSSRCSSRRWEAARTVAVFDDRAERLAAAHWPGPLTLVLPRGADASGWDLGGDPATVGVRAPHHPLALALLAETGPLAVTSANLSGRPPAETCDELQALFGEDVAVYLCQGDRLEGVASTVVDLAHGPASILARGRRCRRARSPSSCRRNPRC